MRPAPANAFTADRPVPISFIVEAKRPRLVAATFEAPSNGITVLFGPPGSGRTAILHAIAGISRPDRIIIDFNGERVEKLAPERRRFAMVFKEGRLFPHLTVRENLLFGLRRAPRKVTRGTAGQVYVDETVALLGLFKLMHRRPAALSAGERQRAAIARALLSQPRLLLMDEPLAGVDAETRDDLLPYLTRLREAMPLPMVYATHVMEEAVRLADHLVLLDNGRVVAQGALSDLASRVDLPLAGRPDAAGVLTGYLHSHDPERGLSAVACGGLVFQVPQQQTHPQTSVRLRIPAREVMLARETPNDISAGNVMPAIVVAIARQKATHSALVELDVGGGQLLSRITLEAADRLRLQAGTRVIAVVEASAVQTL